VSERSLPGPSRIKNSTFEIDGVTYHTGTPQLPLYIYERDADGVQDPNDNNKNDTLHGGSNGWDYRNWTVEAHTTDSVVRPSVIAYAIDSEGSHVSDLQLGRSRRQPRDGIPRRGPRIRHLHSHALPMASTNDRTLDHQEDSHHAELAHVLEPGWVPKPDNAIGPELQLIPAICRAPNRDR